MIAPPHPRVSDHGAERARECTNERCARPRESRCYYHIDEGNRAGGRDWSTLSGHYLCEACYEQYRRRGTLDRSNKKKPLPHHLRKCFYAACDSPTHSGQFVRIDAWTVAAGQDWSPLVGKVLCEACYKRYQRNGSLESVVPHAKRFKRDDVDVPGPAQASASHRMVHEGATPTSSRAAGATGSDRSAQEAAQEAASGRAPQEPTCLWCFRGPRQTRVVPCGHKVVCTSKTCATRAREWKGTCPLCMMASEEPHLMTEQEWIACQALSVLAGRSADLKEPKPPNPDLGW
eukprot:CAMPEP_0173438250 /NCGR_PEP_ID=MMETSP1357-20121228/19832_1 /TAXON_ID=77926 /ORGANISM="Hemiselmis rufescens, Strain PCC563" /LENGTH=288 /DNA_ID=CAMNT_0014403521 /DNA_START=99 /DNA_END=965 /DNA_ORIENTATION=+